MITIINKTKLENENKITRLDGRFKINTDIYEKYTNIIEKCPNKYLL